MFKPLAIIFAIFIFGATIGGVLGSWTPDAPAPVPAAVVVKTTGMPDKTFRVPVVFKDGSRTWVYVERETRAVAEPVVPPTLSVVQLSNGSWVTKDMADAAYAATLEASQGPSVARMVVWALVAGCITLFSAAVAFFLEEGLA